MMLSLIIKIKDTYQREDLIVFMLLSEQARGRPTWSVRATWCPQAPCWWPLV